VIPDVAGMTIQTTRQMKIHKALEMYFL